MDWETSLAALERPRVPIKTCRLCAWLRSDFVGRTTSPVVGAWFFDEMAVGFDCAARLGCR